MHKNGSWFFYWVFLVSRFSRLSRFLIFMTGNLLNPLNLLENKVSIKPNHS